MGNIADWFQKPFRPDGTAVDWFLFFGLLIAISVVWKLILSHTLAE